MIAAAHKPPQGTHVVVAMSGGVDSSTVAAMLVREGYRVTGLTLEMFKAASKGRDDYRCNYAAHIEDARSVCDDLSIPHYVVPMSETFRGQVIEYFVDTYAAGETPNPCLVCNRRIKFGTMIEAARGLDADLMATGHYVRWTHGEREPELHKGADPRRDQSYFLFGVEARHLPFVRFPLGDLHKTETRRTAETLGVPVADKPDSQDICFVPDGKYAGIVTRFRPDTETPGPIRHLDGRRLGTHKGLIHYTVGQRRGLGIGGAGDAVYVIRLDAATNTLIVGPKAALERTRLSIRDVNWLSQERPDADRTLSIKLRSAQPPVAGRVMFRDDGGADVELDESFSGIAPGQGCVFYDGPRLLGGGFILRQDAA